MDLPGKPGDVLHPIRALSEGVVYVSDFESIYLILTFCLVMIAFYDATHKK